MGKKLLKICMAVTLALVLSLSAFACGEVSWKGKVTLTNPGNVVNNGGFLVETDNYVYFINGSESYTAENKFGTPVKGAIMVAEKSKLGSENIAYQTVVPSVVSNGDYGAGIYVYGDSIYYATPSTKKDSSGNVANSHLEFRSMKLDGSGKVTDYITVSGNSTQFRFVEKDSIVYLVYYSTDDSAIISYNTSTKKSTTVVESPLAYTFVDNASIDDAVVIYTENGKDANNETDSTFNLLYAYIAGSEKATLIADGSKDSEGNALAIPVTYAVSFVKGEYVFYTVTTSNDSTVKTYGNTVANFVAKTGAKLYNDATFVLDTTIFDSLEVAYAVDSGYICEINLNDNSKVRKQKGDVSTLLMKKGDFVYYTNSATELVRINVANVEDEEQAVSNGTVNATWYDMVCVGDYLVYLDSTAYGSNYIAYVNTTDTAKGEDTDDDGEEDKWYIEKIYSLAVITSADQVARVSTLISELSSITKLTVDDEGVIEQKADIQEVRDAYNKLTDKQKEEVSEEELAVLTDYESYVKVSEKLVTLMNEYLDEFGNIKVTVTNENKADIQTKLDEITSLTANFDTSDTGYLVDNGMWAVQELQERIDDLKVEE